LEEKKKKKKKKKKGKALDCVECPGLLRVCINVVQLCVKLVVCS
jgi:hypothetical protein